MFKNFKFQEIKFLFSVHLLAISFFTIFRIILLGAEFNQFSDLPNKLYLTSNLFLMGLRFDNVIACYIALFPLLIYSITSTIKFRNKYINYFVFLYLSIAYSAALFICTTDIPYFKQFYKHINSSILMWTGDLDFVVKMIFQSKVYILFFVLYILLNFTFIWILNRIQKYYFDIKYMTEISKINLKHIFLNSIISIVLILTCILGIRGRIEQKSPIRIGTAYFSIYPLPNQLALNPIFYFIKSILDLNENSNIQVIDNKLALEIAKKELGSDTTIHDNFFISRRIKSDSSALKANVVFVIMEGMSANYMQRYGQKQRITPFLDSLAKVSYCFDNFYSAGIHTANGIYSTLFSMPAQINVHPMHQIDIPILSGAATNLTQKGYNSIFFTTHDDQFDNMGGFLRANHFQNLVCQADYPSERILSRLGVADDYLFEFSIDKLNKLAAQNKPFFSAFMTASNHEPIVIPEYFKNHFTDRQDQIIEYSDWAIQKFIAMAKKQSWFDNTIFVFVADHGRTVGKSIYDMPLSYNHIPLIIYSPKYLKPTVFEQFGGQIDIFPTIMGILNESYTNSTLGVDIIKNPRPYMYFSSDDKLACIDKDFLYIYRTNDKESLYNLKLNTNYNYFDENSLIADRMKKYAFSMVQTAQMILEKKKNK